jgi:hypothetical protein
MNIELKITDRTNVEFPIVIKDKKGNVIYCQKEDGFWYESTHDDNNNQLTCKNSEGYWTESTYDNNNNKLNFKASDGFWRKSTYDDNKNQLTYKDSNSNYEIKGKGVTKEVFEAFINNN